MGQINRIPRGYLDLVGTETGGKNPGDASEVVNPTIEMRELYASQTLKSINFAINSLVVGSSSTISVPPEDSWILYSAGMHVNAPLLADQDNVALFAGQLPRGGPAAGFALLWRAEMLSIGVAQTPTDTILFPVPLIFQGGTKFITTVHQRAGGVANRVVNVTLLVGALSG